MNVKRCASKVKIFLAPFIMQKSKIRYIKLSERNDTVLTFFITFNRLRIKGGNITIVEESLIKVGGINGNLISQREMRRGTLFIVITQTVDLLEGEENEVHNSNLCLLRALSNKYREKVKYSEFN
ncbi:uncharacterized protein LOC143187238 [Calliopsis andreniformis]|uniref:uncharacterized protein LOC143187238 n=1 Tax=Calliopsis andreniformis TaxID=337506 RepID=UPI003FCC4753